MANEREIINTPIPDLETPWDNGQQAYSGAAVQEFIRNTMRNITAQKIGKFHCVIQEDGSARMFGFASDETFQMWHEAGENPDDTTYVISSIDFYSKRPSEEEFVLATRMTTVPPAVVVKGRPCIVSFTYDSYSNLDSSVKDPDTGIATVSINSTIIPELTRTLTSGGAMYNLDLGQYLTASTNSVEITVANSAGKTRKFRYSIEAKTLDLWLDDGLDESQLREGAWDLRVHSGGCKATIRVSVDGVEKGRSTVQGESTSRDFTIDRDGTLAPGKHEITVYAENTELGLRTDTLRFSFIKSGSGLATVCIGGQADAVVQMYATASIPYFCHVPGHANEEIPVTIVVSDTEGNEVARKQQTVTTRADGTSAVTDFRFAALDNFYVELGQLRITVNVGSASAQHLLTITPSEVELATESECKVYFSAAGKTNADADAEDWSCQYNGVETCRFERSSNFHLTGDNGFGNDRYLIKAGKRVTLAGYRPFAQDIGANGNKQGATIDFELKTLNCTNTSAKIISCFNGNTGFEVYADKAVLYVGGQSVKTIFSDNERIRVGFVVNGTTVRTENKKLNSSGGYDVTTGNRNVAFIYVNGVVSRLLDYSESKWICAENIVIGSDECDVELYTVRGYEKSLGFRAMVGNYAYDTPNVEDKVAIAKRNDVLSDDGSVNLAKVKVALPNTPIVIWEMSRMPTGKKDWVTTNTQFENPWWKALYGLTTLSSFVCMGHDQALDGTSSLNYPDPYKNWASKYNKDIKIMVDGIEVHITRLYSITIGIVGAEREFAHKVNFASSEGIGNILAMNAYQQILLGVADAFPGILTPMQANQQALGEDIVYRHSLSGFPEIGFLRTYEGEGDNKVAKIDFLSLFNFINNKYSASIFGLPCEGVECQIWEVEDNVNGFAEHIEPGYWDDNEEDAKKKWKDRATTLYYSRYTKDLGVAADATQVDLANSQTEWLRTFHNWVVSVNPRLAERYKAVHGEYKPLSSPVTYGSETYYEDNPKYRLSKFTAEKDDYLAMDSVLMYFLFCDYHLGTDSFDKNMSIAFIKLATEARPKAWIFLRDTDTINRYNNSDKLAFQYWHEWNDSYDATTETTGSIVGENYDPATGTFTPVTTAGSAVYNAAMSGLWDCVWKSCQSELRTMYAAMKNAGLNATALMKLYNSMWSQWCENLYNVDAMGYVNTGEFDMSHGDKRESFRQFYKYRERYMDSKYGISASNVEIRAFGNFGNVALRYNTPIYASMNYGAGSTQTVRNLHAGTPSLFPSSLTGANETTVTIYDADILTKITSYRINALTDEIEESGLQDICSGGLRIRNLKNCKLLEELILDYPQNNPNTILDSDVSEIGTSIALKRLIIRNCTNINNSINLSSEKIEEVDLRGSSITGFSVPETDSLATLRLGSTLTSLRLKGLGNLQGSGFSMQGYSRLTDLDVRDCPGLDVAIRQMLSAIFSGENVLERVTLRNINWTGVTSAELLNLARINADITGIINMGSNNLNAEAKAACVAAWGDINSENNPLHIIYNPVPSQSVVIYGAPSEITSVGDYQLTMRPTPVNANDIRTITWAGELQGYATIDPTTGVLHVTAIGDEYDSPTIAITVSVDKENGDVLTATHSIRLYRRSCAVGDLLYADGSTSSVSERDMTKTVVGVCFYVNPENPMQRLAVAKENILINGDKDIAWGLANIGPQFSPGGVQGITLSSGENAYDVDGLTNWPLAAAITLDESNIMGLTAYNSGNALSECGFSRRGVPFGKANTESIVAHRDKVLNDPNINDSRLRIPTATLTKSEFDDLMSILVNIWSGGGNYSERYTLRTYMYPAASLCYAYEPGVMQGEHLADGLKAHNWFLPAIGDLALLCYRYNNNDYMQAASSFLPIFGTQNVWSSTETSSVNKSAYVDFGNSQVLTSLYKSDNIIVVPIVAF